MNGEDLGPLFHQPYDPTYLWLVGAGISLLAIGFALFGLVRGRMTVAAAATGLALLPAFAYVIGYLFLMEESKQVEFCGSCHETMGPIAGALRTDGDTLAAAHYRVGAVSQEEACYQCHSGYGIWGAVGAKQAGIRHMLHTVTGEYHFPLEVRSFDVNSCLGCHAQSAPFREAEDHRDPDLQEALLSGEIGCTGDCHDQAHPDSALLGAAAQGK